MLPGDVGIDPNFSQNPKRNGSSLNETALHCESETSRWIHYDASISPVKRSEDIFDKLTLSAATFPSKASFAVDPWTCFKRSVLSDVAHRLIQNLLFAFA